MTKPNWGELRSILEEQIKAAQETMQHYTNLGNIDQAAAQAALVKAFTTAWNEVPSDHDENH